MTNFHVLGKEINLSKLLIPINLKSFSIRINYHLFQYFLPAIIYIRTFTLKHSLKTVSLILIWVLSFVIYINDRMFWQTV